MYFAVMKYILLFLVLSITTAAQTSKKDVWTELTTTKTPTYTLTYSVNPTRIVKSRTNISLWVKTVPSDRVAYFNMMFRGEIPSTVPPNEYEYDLTLYRANCASRVLGKIKTLSYWKSGHIDINKEDVISSDQVAPDSVEDAILRYVCKNY